MINLFSTNKLIYTLVITCCFALPISAQTYLDLPVVSPSTEYAPVYESRDLTLQEKLNAEISARPQWKKLVAQKKMSVALVDITIPEAPLYSAVNGEHTMYAASMPKIAILLAAFQKMHDGELQDTPQLRKDLSAMIKVSSNTSATKMIDAVGGLDAVNSVLTDPRYKLYDEERGGGLWVGKRYAKKGRRIGDPMKNISHAASTMSVARFYYLLATGRLVSPQASKEMLEIMSEPGIKHKFVASLNGNVEGSDIYRKSGSWRTYHADSALVWEDDWRQYILVGIVESPDGGKILKDFVPVAEKILKASDDN